MSAGTERPDSADRGEVWLLMRSPGNRKVLTGFLAEHRLTGVGIGDETELRHRLRTAGSVRLALVDTSGFGAAVWPLCEQLRSAAVPFIVLSTERALGASHEALAYGALSILQKPVAKAALVHLLNRLDRVSHPEGEDHGTGSASDGPATADQRPDP